MVTTRIQNATCVPYLQLVRTDDGSATLLDRRTGVTFHSQSGAATETEHVYVRNSGAWQRLQRGFGTRVLEVGFGTAMAFLQTVDVALQREAPLDYIAIEPEPLPREILQQVGAAPGLDADFRAAFFAAWADWQAGTAPAEPFDWSRGALRLRVFRSDLTASAAGCAKLTAGSFDALYFDPFAPAAVPALWSLARFRRLRPLLSEAGRLTTYCVARSIRDRLINAGFEVRCVPGPPGGKREVLIAEPDRRGTDKAPREGELE